MTIATGQDILAADILARMPSGLIAMWHGLLANIPSGWVLCDGNNGTPNLLDRFVQGVVNASTNPGDTGGATSKTTAGHIHTIPNTSTVSASQHEGVEYANETTPSHYHTVPNANSNTDSISDIRPKYYAIAFIMKT
jgi:hypothetical protein